MPVTSTPVDHDDALVLNALLEYYGDFEEIWIGPAIRNLSEKLKDEVLFVKRSIRRLTNSGAIAVESRKGEPHDYHVIAINEEHPIVIQAREGTL